MARHMPTRIEAIRSGRTEAHRRQLTAAWAAIKQECAPRGLTPYLFGSFARGGIHDRSDLDIFIDTGSSKATHWEIARSLDMIASTHGIDIDLHFRDEEPDLFDRLRQDGEVDLDAA